jgi:hypothetical protein
MQTSARVFEEQAIRTPRHAWFYLAAAILAALLAVLGFAQTYYLKLFFDTPPLSLLLHVHAAIFTSWLLLFIAQTTLVAVHRVDLHRRLGIAGAVLAVLMVVVGILTAIDAARLGHAPFGIAPLAFLAIPVIAVALFAILAGAGLYYRRRSREAHKRLMLLATISLITPPISRLPFGIIQKYGPPAFFGLTDLILLACIVYDTIKHRRLHPAMAWGGLLFLASQPARLAISHTQAWLAFAHWLTQ